MSGPVIGSLCSGYGGLDMAAVAVLGGRVAWHVEYDAAPSRILAHHWPHIPNHGDVKHTDWTQVEPIEVLTAGYPCQPFSHAGRRAGHDDPRHLWPDVAQAVRVLRPSLVLLENVAGHLSLGFGSVLGDLAEAGYDAEWVCVRASDAGAPHGRARLFIAATDTRRGELQRRGGSGVLGGAPAGAGGEAREQRHGDAAVDRGATAADAARLGRGEGWPEPAGRGGRPEAELCGTCHGSITASDADSPGPQGPQPAARRDVSDGGVAADADVVGREGVAQLHAAPQAREHGADRGHADGRSHSAVWGAYAPAIRRWELISGRRAPRPTEPAARAGGRERLSPTFVEWMMGLPAGHVTAVPGLSRSEQLKALGNGCVPQQCALAYRLLLNESGWAVAS